MPFKSEKQRRYLWANEPKIAREWTDRYGAADGGIMRLNFASGINPEMQKIIATLRENNPGKYDKFTDQELAENFASITATGFNDDVVIDVEDVQNIDDFEAYPEGDASEYKQSFLTQLKNTANKYANPIKNAVTSGLGAMMNVPGLGFVLNAFNRPEYPSDAMSKNFAVENYGDPYNYNMGSGNLTGKDPFGINTVSMFGNYPAYYDQYVRDYEACKYSPKSQFAKDKYAHGLDVVRKNKERIAKDFANTDAEDDYGAGNYIGPVNTHDSHPYHNDGGNQNIGSTKHGSSGMTKDEHSAFRYAKGGSVKRKLYGKGGIVEL